MSETRPEQVCGGCDHVAPAMEEDEDTGDAVLCSGICFRSRRTNLQNSYRSSIQTIGQLHVQGGFRIANPRRGARCAVHLLRSEVNSELNFSPNFEGLVLGCIDADFCK